MNCEICKKDIGEDETSACTLCIEETVTTDGERIAGLLAGRLKSVPNGQEIEDQINNWYQILQEMTLHPELGDLALVTRFLNVPRSLNIARLVVTRSLRLKITPDEVIEEVIQVGPKIILPNLDKLY